jgi:hypothetical protein
MFNLLILMGHFPAHKYASLPRFVLLLILKLASESQLKLLQGQIGRFNKSFLDQLQYVEEQRILSVNLGLTSFFAAVYR